MKKMKKILLLFIVLVAANFVNVKAATFTSKFIGTYHYVDQNGKWGDFEMFYRTDNHRVAYLPKNISNMRILRPPRWLVT